jgi:hypothetical protein
LFTWKTHIQRVSGKASKCVGLMRRACRELPRACLETLYLSMVRPILEYGGLLLDGSPLKHTKFLDSIQREAALVCTGAYKHTKTLELLNELGWDPLTTRRSNQKLCMMYKIQNDLAPNYLVQSCPPLVGAVHNYNLRNVEDITSPMGRKAGYINSFMPSAIKLWNGLDRKIRSRTSIDSFKYHLKKAKNKKQNKLYPKFNGPKAINHTRMRMGLSGLKSQRHDYNHVPDSKCDFCGARKEDPMHFFLQCPVFAPMRIILLANVTSLYQTKNITRDLTRTLVKKELVGCLLKGDIRLDIVENTKLFDYVQQFICSSKRFT